MKNFLCLSFSNHGWKLCLQPFRSGGVLHSCKKEQIDTVEYTDIIHYIHHLNPISLILQRPKRSTQHLISLQEIPVTFANGASDIPKFSWQIQQQKQLWGCYPGLMFTKTKPSIINEEFRWWGGGKNHFQSVFTFGIKNSSHSWLELGFFLLPVHLKN